MTRKLLFVIGGLIAVALIAGGIFFGRSFFAQPSKNDFTHLNNLRAIVKDSRSAYQPVIEEYSREIGNVYREGRSDEEKQAIETRMTEWLEQEREMNKDRLNSMRSSLAMKDSAVKEKFNEFEKQQYTVLDYFEQFRTDSHNIARSIAGPCAGLSKMNVGISSYPADYAKASETCLTVLAEAKKDSSEPMKKLLGSMESMIRERHDKFKEAAEKEGIEATTAKMIGLTMQLEVNGLLAKYQETYQADMKKRFDELSSKVEAADKALEKATKEAGERAGDQ